jgi:hypothetical protein
MNLFPSPETAVRILYLEDDPVDAEALWRAIQRLRPELDVTMLRATRDLDGDRRFADVLVVDAACVDPCRDRLEAAAGSGMVVVTRSGESFRCGGAVAWPAGEAVCFEELGRALDPLLAAKRRAAGERLPACQRRQVAKPKGR